MKNILVLRLDAYREMHRIHSQLFTGNNLLDHSKYLQNLVYHLIHFHVWIYLLKDYESMYVIWKVKDVLS